MADNVDYSALLPPDATQQQQALARALRGQQLQVQSNTALLGNPADLANVQAEQAKEGMAALGQSAQRNIEAAKALRETRALEYGISKTEREQELEREKFGAELGQRDIANDRAAKELGLSFTKNRQEETHKGEAQLEDVGKALDPHAEFYSNLRKVNDILQKHPDAPGMGVAGGRIPNVFTSDEGQELRKLAGKLSLSYDRATGGARAIQPGLLDRLADVNGLNQVGTVTSLYQGLKNLKDDNDATVRATLAGKPEGAVRKYFANKPGLPRYLNPFAAEPAAKTPAAASAHSAAEVWLADPKNASDPRRAQVEAKVKAAKAGGTQ
jgi:hypothetical protein